MDLFFGPNRLICQLNWGKQFPTDVSLVSSFGDTGNNVMTDQFLGHGNTEYLLIGIASDLFLDVLMKRESRNW